MMNVNEVMEAIGYLSDSIHHANMLRKEGKDKMYSILSHLVRENFSNIKEHLPGYIKTKIKGEKISDKEIEIVTEALLEDLRKISLTQEDTRNKSFSDLNRYLREGKTQKFLEEMKDKNKNYSSKVPVLHAFVELYKPADARKNRK